MYAFSAAMCSFNFFLILKKYFFTCLVFYYKNKINGRLETTLHTRRAIVMSQLDGDIHSHLCLGRDTFRIGFNRDVFLFRISAIILFYSITT